MLDVQRHMIDEMVWRSIAFAQQIRLVRLS